MQKKGNRSHSLRNETEQEIATILRNTNRWKNETIISHAVARVKQFFQAYLDMKSSVTLDDIIEESQKKKDFSDALKKNIAQNLTCLMDLHYGASRAGKEDIRRFLHEFKDIVRRIIPPEEKAKKKTVNERGKLAHAIYLTGYDKEIRPYMAKMMAARDHLKAEDVRPAQAIYQSLLSRYQILSEKMQKRLFGHLQDLLHDIETTYSRVQEKELDRIVDLSHRYLTKHKVKNAEAWYRKANLIYEELPKKVQGSRFGMMQDLYDGIQKIKMVAAIEDIRRILSEIEGMEKDYSYPQLKKKFDQARDHFRQLSKADKAKVFKEMKRIKRKNDMLLITSSAALISDLCQQYWDSRKLEETKMVRAYEKAQAAYDELDPKDKAELYAPLRKSYALLIEAVIHRKIGLANVLFQKKKVDYARLLDCYTAIMELYDQLPDIRKKQFFKDIAIIYGKIPQALRD